MSSKKLKERIRKLQEKVLNKDQKQVVPETSFGLKVVSDLIAGLIVGGFCGYILDRILNISPLFLIIGLILGFGLGFYIFYRELMRSFKNKKDKNA